MKARAVLLVALLATCAFAGWYASGGAQRALGFAEDARPPARRHAPRPPPAEEPPPPQGQEELALDRRSGTVADAAGQLVHFADVLEWQTKALAEDLGIDVHVATLRAPDLPAETLAPSVMDLRRVGADAQTGGLLILLNPARREARIEVSYALEAALPDALAGRIAHDQLAPYAGSGMAGMAAMDVLHFLSDFLIQQAIDGRLELAEPYRKRPAFAARARYLSGGGGASVKWPTAEELASRDYKQPIAEPARAKYAAGTAPLPSAEAQLRAYLDVAGDPTLELYTEGSRCMRSGYPVAPYEELQRGQRLAASKPWRVIEQGDYAVVTSDRPAPGFVPVLLHREDGLWRVDLVETWKNLFFGRDGEYFTKNATQPYGFGLAAFGSGTDNDVAPFDLGGASIESVDAALAKKKGAFAEYLRGELLFRNCFRAVDALAHYEEASRLAPEAPAFRATLGRRAEYLGLTSVAITAYERLGDAAALDLARLHLARGEAEKSLEWARRAQKANPYDAEALLAVSTALASAGDPAGAEAAAQERQALLRDPTGKASALAVRFDPPQPELHLDGPTQVGEFTIYDHSEFRVTLENRSNRPIELVGVHLVSAGTGPTSGLGEIRSYWPSLAKVQYRIPAHESVWFVKTWGFLADMPHEQLSYVFELCWRGEGDAKQCRTERVDLFPH